MNKTILIIEDNFEVRENTKEILELSNYNVHAAENGKEGVKLAKQHLPDLIICDIMMPELDGYGVLHMLNKDIQTATIPFIFLTAKADKSEIRKGMSLGADDYLTKPFDDTELLDSIDTRLRKIDQLKTISDDKLEQITQYLTVNKGVKELDDLMLVKKHKIYEKKQIIYSEGDHAQYLYFIQNGKVKCTKSDDYGKELMIEILQNNDFFGYHDLMCAGEHSESATAMEESEIVLIPKSDFEQLIQNNRDIAVQFIKMLSNNVKEKEERLLRLAFTPVRERTAFTLLDLQQKFSPSEGIKISREDLASIVGTATESLIRTLSDFKEEGLIEIAGREIKIIDEKQLKKLGGV